MGFMSDDEKYGEDKFDELEKRLFSIDNTSCKIAEWIWKKENLSLDKNWHELTFQQVDIKIWKLITEERN